MDYRKARTRTLIMLGGLVEKAELLDKLGLKLGDDLQRDIDCLEGAATLMGALGEIHETLSRDDSEAQKILWAERGKELLTG